METFYFSPTKPPDGDDDDNGVDEDRDVVTEENGKRFLKEHSKKL